MSSDIFLMGGIALCAFGAWPWGLVCFGLAWVAYRY